MSYKLARWIGRAGEESDYPSFDLRRQPHLAQFAKFAVSGIAAGPAADAPLLEVNRRARGKLDAGRRHDTSTALGRALAWGDASVVDYLLFPSRPLYPAASPFHFSSRLDPAGVRDTFRNLTILDDRPVSDLDDLLRRTLSSSLLVIRDGSLLYEQYYNRYRRDSLTTSFSVAKSFASTLVGIAIDEGIIASVDDPVTRYLPELQRRNARMSRITIADLLTMMSGLRYREDPPDRDDIVTYLAPDLRRAALHETAIVEAPGARFHYNNYNPLLVGLILERTTGRSVTTYLQDKLWSPLGMEFAGSWSTDSEASGFEKMESGLNARAIDFAKLGQLFLQDGRWHGRPLVSARWVAEATQPRERSVDLDGGYYGYFWWRRERKGGRSDFFGLGNKGQILYISPQKGLVILRSGIEYGLPAAEWTRLFHDFASRFPSTALVAQESRGER